MAVKKHPQTGPVAFVLMLGEESNHQFAQRSLSIWAQAKGRTYLFPALCMVFTYQSNISTAPQRTYHRVEILAKFQIGQQCRFDRSFHVSEIVPPEPYTFGLSQTIQAAKF